MTEIPERKPRGMMVYPQSAWRKLFMKMPLYYWRMGLGPILKRWFLVLTTAGRKSGQPRHTMLEFSWNREDNPHVIPSHPEVSGRGGRDGAIASEADTS